MGFFVTTIAGAFVFGFMLRLVFGALVDEFGTIGGWLAAGFVVGTCWALTHGVGLIQQSGAAWVDQAFAGFASLFVASAIFDKASVGKGITNGIVAICGGVLGGFILSCSTFFNA